MLRPTPSAERDSNYLSPPPFSQVYRAPATRAGSRRDKLTTPRRSDRNGPSDSDLELELKADDIFITGSTLHDMEEPECPHRSVSHELGETPQRSEPNNNSRGQLTAYDAIQVVEVLLSRGNDLLASDPSARYPDQRFWESSNEEITRTSGRQLFLGWSSLKGWIAKNSLKYRTVDVMHAQVPAPGSRKQELIYKWLQYWKHWELMVHAARFHSSVIEVLGAPNLKQKLCGQLRERAVVTNEKTNYLPFIIDDRIWAEMEKRKAKLSLPSRESRSYSCFHDETDSDNSGDWMDLGDDNSNELQTLIPDPESKISVEVDGDLDSAAQPREATLENLENLEEFLLNAKAFPTINSSKSWEENSSLLAVADGPKPSCEVIQHEHTAEVDSFTSPAFGDETTSNRIEEQMFSVISAATEEEEHNDVAQEFRDDFYITPSPASSQSRHMRQDPVTAPLALISDSQPISVSDFEPLAKPLELQQPQADAETASPLEPARATDDPFVKPKNVIGYLPPGQPPKVNLTSCPDKLHLAWAHKEVTSDRARLQASKRSGRGEIGLAASLVSTREYNQAQAAIAKVERRRPDISALHEETPPRLFYGPPDKPIFQHFQFTGKHIKFFEENENESLDEPGPHKLMPNGDTRATRPAGRSAANNIPSFTEPDDDEGSDVKSNEALPPLSDLFQNYAGLRPKSCEQPQSPCIPAISDSVSTRIVTTPDGQDEFTHLADSACVDASVSHAVHNSSKKASDRQRQLAQRRNKKKKKARRCKAYTAVNTTGAAFPQSDQLPAGNEKLAIPQSLSDRRVSWESGPGGATQHLSTMTDEHDEEPINSHILANASSRVVDSRTACGATSNFQNDTSTQHPLPMVHEATQVEHPNVLAGQSSNKWSKHVSHGISPGSLTTPRPRSALITEDASYSINQLHSRRGNTYSSISHQRNQSIVDDQVSSTHTSSAREPSALSSTVENYLSQHGLDHGIHNRFVHQDRSQTQNLGYSSDAWSSPTRSTRYGYKNGRQPSWTPSPATNCSTPHNRSGPRTPLQRSQMSTSFSQRNTASSGQFPRTISHHYKEYNIPRVMKRTGYQPINKTRGNHASRRQYERSTTFDTETAFLGSTPNSTRLGRRIIELEAEVLHAKRELKQHILKPAFK